MSRFDTGKVMAPVAVSLVVFIGLFSGGTYPWAASVFAFGATFIFLLSLGSQNPDWKVLAPVLPFLAALYLSSFWTVNLNNTLTRTFYVTALVFFSFAVANGITGGRRRQLLNALFWTASVVSIYGIYQYFIGFPRTEEFLREYGAASGLTSNQIADAASKLKYRRAFSTMFSPNIMACYIAMVIPVGLDLFMGSRKGRVLYGVLIGVMVLALFLTKSAGGVVAFASGILIYAIAKKRSRFSGRHAAAALLVIVVLSLFGAWIIASRSDNAFGVGNSFSKRLDYWHSAIDITGRSPVIGNGAGSFEILYSQYKREGSDEVRYAHNLFLQVLAETGIVGAASLTLFFFLFLQKCLSGLRRAENEFIPGIIAGGAAFLVHNMIDFSFFIPETAVVFFLYLGLAYSKDGVTAATGSMSSVIKGTALASALLFAFFFTKGYIAAAYEDGALAVLAEKGITSRMAAGSAPPPPEAVELAKKAVETTPYDDKAHAFLAGLYEGQAARDGEPLTDKALDEYRTAIRLNPFYPYHYRDLGLLYLKLGDKGKAVGCFKAALSHYPTSPALAQYLKLAENK